MGWKVIGGDNDAPSASRSMKSSSRSMGAFADPRKGGDASIMGVGPE